MPAPGSASSARREPLTSYELILGEAELENAIVATDIPGLFIIPASQDLAGADLEFTARERREFLLSRAVRSRVGDYDDVSDRLSAVTEPADDQCAGRGRFGAGAVAMRILCARRAEPADAYDRTGSAGAQPAARHCRGLC